MSVSAIGEYYLAESRDEIVAILLGGGPEHLDRTARLRASAQDAPGSCALL
jgi:hypothetical protein